MNKLGLIKRFFHCFKRRFHHIFRQKHIEEFIDRLEENRNIAKQGGQVANNTRKDIESRLGESIVTKDNELNYQYIDESKQIENK